MLRAIQKSLLRRPSIAVATCCVVVLGLFAWRGDLRLESVDSPARASGGASKQQSVVVRRSGVRSPSTAPAVARAGRVIDSMGFLLVGAEVVPDTGASVRTDAEGAFTVDLVEGRTSDLLIRADGRAPQWLRASAASSDPVWICLRPSAPWDQPPTPPSPLPDLRGEGLVRDAAGRPLPFAFVNVLGSECWGQADDIGRVVLPLPSQAVTFSVHRPATQGGITSLAAISEPFVASRASGIVPLPELHAEAAGSIRGLARDARGHAIVGLAVEARGAGCRRRAVTGSGGSFVISGLVPADYEVEPLPYRGAIGEAVAVRLDRAVVECDVQLRRVEEASLRVVDERGTAAAGVWVAAIMHGLRRAVVQADAEGVVHLPVDAATTFEVRSAGTYADREVRQFDSSAEPVTLVIAQP